MEEMWESSLKGGLGCIQGKLMHLSDYFVCNPARESVPFDWEGLAFTPVNLPYVMAGYKNHYSYGLIVAAEDGQSAFISTDTQFQPDLLMQIANKTAVVFHDCETADSKTGVHAHCDQLKRLPARLKEKMRLCHYQIKPSQNPREDGFRGFVEKGEEFELFEASKVSSNRRGALHLIDKA